MPEMEIETESETKRAGSVQVRSVWADNLVPEFDLIRSQLDRGRVVATMDTEFPGAIFRPGRHPRLLSVFERYDLLKSNVDVLDLIQFGLTLSSSDAEDSMVWEFNLKEFDPTTDLHAPESVDLLRSQGIDFEKNKVRGIDARDLGELMVGSGLFCNDSEVSWVTFHSAYDFGYLIKILTCKPLPDSLMEFLRLVRVFFGDKVFDMKHMMNYCEGLYGGLDKMARTLGVDRVVGKCHQAGSDSLLTWHAFQRMKERYFEMDHSWEERVAGVLYGLEVC